MAKKPPARSEDLTGKGDIREKAEDLFETISKGFEAQRDRTNSIKDNWDYYNCKLGDRQFYNGTSQIALPFVHDAVEARVTRFTGQVFPTSGRYVEVICSEDPPQATQSLIETYVRKTKLRSKIVPALIRNGDLEGMWAIYVTWRETKRTVVYRTKVQPQTNGMDNPAAEEVEDFQEQVVTDAYPDVEVLSDPDILLLPAASNSIDDALDDGGCFTILRRWSKAKIKKLIAEKEINKEEGEELLEEMNKQRSGQDVDLAKEQLDAAGIKERGKVAIVYETWTKLKVNKEERLCRIYMVSADKILSVRLNPFWNDRCPAIGGPVRKIGGVWKSQPPVTQVGDLQIYANDTLNEGADTGHFSAMPIVMTDPLKNPRVDTMTLGLAAVWQTSPSDTAFASFPPLWKDCFDRVMATKEQIFQTLGVNPSMIPQSTGGAKKRNQAEIANEQQVDILTTADVVTSLEETILTPFVQRCAEYDHQFRDKAKSIAVFGELGQQANMEDVEPMQLNERYEFRWLGVEAARNAAQMQQQISWLNVIKQIPPDQYQGYKLDLAPFVVEGTQNVFGPRLASRIFSKIQFVTVDPLIENDMLLHGFDVPVHAGDDDMEHMKVHMQLLQVGDPHGKAQEHMMMHQQQMMAKSQQQQAQMQGGGGQQQGGRGPRPGAQPGQGRPAQQPAGAMHKDSMPAAGAPGMPRKMA